MAGCHVGHECEHTWRHACAPTYPTRAPLPPHALAQEEFSRLKKVLKFKERDARVAAEEEAAANEVSAQYY